jgi:RES domain-containing protein
MTRIYRLQSAQYGLPNDFISGRGAEITGGRWNRVGVPLVYASLTIELAALEYLVDDIITKIEPFYVNYRYQKPQIQGTQMNDLIEGILGG